MTRSTLTALVSIAILGTSMAQGGLWQDVYRGLDFAATPLGGPLQSAGDGTRINGARSGRLRIVPSGIGPGYQLEFDRTFGNDSRGRPEVLRFGGLGELQLSGQSQFTLGYNGKEFRTARASFGLGNLAYELRSKVGAQDAELTGTLNAFSELELNPLGFYSVQVNVSNTDSQFKLDGVVVRDSQDSNFDIGPISIEGNIFVDGAVALLSALGVDTSPLENIFPKSPIDQINNTIAGGIQETRAVAGASANADLATLLLNTVLGADQNAADTLLHGLAEGTLGGSSQGARTPPLSVPEPGMLLLAVLGGTVFGRRR